MERSRRHPGQHRALLAVAVLAILAAGAVSAQDVTGVWRTEATDEGYLELGFAACGEAVCATILRARDTTGTEQPYPHTGRQMIWDMVPDGPGAWSGGNIWDPRNDQTFRSRMELSGDELRVSGCFLGICQHQTWQRVE